MTPKQIEVAEAEAKRFLARCKAARDDTKATAALKRASMDLSRALADIRRAGA